MDESMPSAKSVRTVCLIVGLFLVYPFMVSGQTGKGAPGTADTRQNAPHNDVFAPSPLLSVRGLEQQIASARIRGIDQWGYKEAYLYWLRQRAYPNDTVDWKAYAAAYVRRALMPIAKFKLAPGLAPGITAITQPQWEFVGPHNLPVPYELYYGQGTTSGRVNDVAFDSSENGAMYIATAGGGVWKRTKQADSTWQWTPLSDNWKNLKTSSVAVDPSHPKRVFVGTGDFDGGASAYGYGVQRSTDGGQNWTLIASKELDGLSTRRILIDPDMPDVITVAAGRNSSESRPGKLLRSDNGGNTWQEINPSTVPGAKPADWQDIKCGKKDSNGKRWCYAVGASIGGEVLRTNDHGQHWDKIYPPLNSRYQQSLAVATSQKDPETIYLLSGTDEIILRSDSHGDRWESITRGFPSCLANQSDYNWSQSDYDFYIETSLNPESNQDVIYVGLIDIVASLDGGQTWVSVGKTFQNDALTHNDQHSLVVNPRNPNELLVGNDGGVYEVTFDPTNKSWTFQTDLNARLGLTQFYRLAVHPTDSSVMVGGAQDNASPVSTGDVENWKNVGGGDGGFSAISAAVPATQYATTQGLEIYRTLDQWTSWDIDNADHCCITYAETINGQRVTWKGDPTGFIGPIALDPNHQDILYAGTNYLWRWNGTNWATHLGDQLLALPPNPKVTPDNWDTISTIAVAPSDSKRIYTASQTGQLWMSTSSGASGSWKQVKGPTLPAFWITGIAVHPTNPDTILITFSGTAGKTSPHPGHVWRCSNMSSATPRCSNISGTALGQLPNIPANTLVIDPKSPDMVYYAGTDVGVFVTKNGGITWADFGNSLGLPNVQVNYLMLQEKAQYLFAATFGRGIWRIKLPSPSSPAFREMLIQPRMTLQRSQRSNANSGSLSNR
jgi:photosystem II stability/assembly factor-like uncharacterized protein